MAKLSETARIRWNDQECTLVAEDAWRLIRKGLSRSDAIVRAQKVLPASRQRATHNVFAIRKTVEPFLMELMTKPADNPAPAPVPDPVPTLTIDPPAAAVAPPPAVSNPPSMSDLWLMCAPVLVALVRDAFIEASMHPQFRYALVDLLTAPPPAKEPPKDPPKEQPADKQPAGRGSSFEISKAVPDNLTTGIKPQPLPDIRPKQDAPQPDLHNGRHLESIAVVGLLPRQAQIIRDRYGDYFDIRFVEAHATKGTIAGVGRTAAVIFIMTNFIGKPERDLFKTCGVQMVYVTGSTSSLEEALETRLNQQRQRIPVAATLTMPARHHH